MSLPDLSFMMTVGQVRYVQSRFERSDLRNPDSQVGALLSAKDKLRCLVRGLFFMRRIRSNPFYYFVLARTRHYDSVFAQALDRGVAAIINIGCGGDTRSLRFADQAKLRGTRIYECDQAEAIQAKERIVRRRWPSEHIRFLPIDLNDDVGPVLGSIIEQHAGKAVLVMLEGVSPYIETAAFERFLSQLSQRLTPDSMIAYDFKCTGVADALGVSGRVRSPFRLASDEVGIKTFHARHGLTIRECVRGADLQAAATTSEPLFSEDLLVLAAPMTSTE